MYMLFCCFPKSTFVMIYACVNMMFRTMDKISPNGLMLKKEFRQIAAWRNRKKKFVKLQQRHKAIRPFNEILSIVFYIAHKIHQPIPKLRIFTNFLTN